jgi:nucleoside-diphosphate-sugar epimerase
LTRSFFITGAAGCVGLALLERLAIAGTEVIGMDISPRPLDCPASVSWVRGDLLDTESYERALQGVDTVVHLAAKVHSVPKTQEDSALFFRMNVEGTRNVLGAAVRSDVQKFLFVSTVAVLAPPAGNITDSYAESKRAAEKAVLDEAHGLGVVIARPATVYGPRDRGNVYRLIRWIDRGLPPVIGSGTNRKSMVFVRSLAEAIFLLAERGEDSRAYVVTDGKDLSMNEIVAAIARSLGRRNFWPTIPLSVAKALVGINEWLAQRTGTPRLLSREVVEKLAEETVYDSSDLFALGFSPAVGVEQGIAEAVAWYKRSAH